MHQAASCSIVMWVVSGIVIGDVRARCSAPCKYTNANLTIASLRCISCYKVLAIFFLGFSFWAPSPFTSLMHSSVCAFAVMCHPSTDLSLSCHLPALPFPSFCCATLHCSFGPLPFGLSLGYFGLFVCECAWLNRIIIIVIARTIRIRVLLELGIL